MRFRAFLLDEAGAVTIDWVVLTAGVVLLGIVVVFSVMENSSGYLLEEFDALNKKYSEDAVKVSDLRKP